MKKLGDVHPKLRRKIEELQRQKAYPCMLIAMTDYCQTLLQQIKAIDVSVIFFS